MRADIGAIVDHITDRATQLANASQAFAQRQREEELVAQHKAEAEELRRVVLQALKRALLTWDEGQIGVTPPSVESVSFFAECIQYEYLSDPIHGMYTPAMYAILPGHDGNVCAVRWETPPEDGYGTWVAVYRLRPTYQGSVLDEGRFALYYQDSPMRFPPPWTDLLADYKALLPLADEDGVITFSDAQPLGPSLRGMQEGQ